MCGTSGSGWMQTPGTSFCVFLFRACSHVSLLSQHFHIWAQNIPLCRQDRCTSEAAARSQVQCEGGDEPVAAGTGGRGMLVWMVRQSGTRQIALRPRTAAAVQLGAMRGCAWRMRSQPVSSRAANGLYAMVPFSLKHILLLAIAGGR